MNIRGVGGTPKYLALHWLIELTHPNAIFVQETMVLGSEAREVFGKNLKD